MTVRRIIDATVTAGIVLSPLVGVFVSKGMAPLFVLVVLVMSVVAFRDGTWRQVPRPLVALFAAIVGWALVSGLWALDYQQSLTTSVRLALGCLGGTMAVAVVSRLPVDRLRGLLPLYAASVLIATAVVFTDYVTGNGVSALIFKLLHGTDLQPGYKSRLSHGATLLSLLLWPLVILVMRRFGGWAAGMLAVCVVAALLAGDSLSTKLAVIGGATVFVACAFAPRASLLALRLVVVALMVALPIGMSHLPPPQKTFNDWRWLPLSAHHRLTIWSFTAEMAAQKPVLGWGMDAARDIPGAQDVLTVKRFDAQGNVQGMLFETKLPLHPHNAVLQWWLELGGVGLVLMAAFIWWLLRRIESLPVSSWERAACAATFAAAFAVSAVSYGFWQYWWNGAMWLAAIACAVAVARAPHIERKP